MTDGLAHAVNAATPCIWLSAVDPAEAVTPEFLRRELGLKAIHWSELPSRPTPESPALAFAYTHPSEIRALRGFPPRTIRLIVGADETYNPALTREILRQPAVCEVLRSYPFHPGSLADRIKAIWSSFQQLVEVGGADPKGALTAAAAGQVLAYRSTVSRSKFRRAGIRVMGLPLGYADQFVKGLHGVAHMGHLPPLPAEGTLLDYFQSIRPELVASKSTLLAFVGQRGKFQRNAGLRVANSMNIDIGPIRSSFSEGHASNSGVAEEYVRSLQYAKFALLPPGNYSGDTFRLYESVLMACVPIAAFPTLSDPFRPKSLWIGEGGIVSESWGSALEMAVSAGPEVVAERLQQGILSLRRATLHAASMVRGNREC